MYDSSIQAYLAEVIVPANNSELSVCLRIYKEMKGYGDLFLYEACIRKLLGYGISFGKIKILHKGTGWARDSRLTNSKWNNENDFMFHNWKERNKIFYASTPVPIVPGSVRYWSTWYNPIVGKLELDLCTPG
ncbi:hypothetical protein ANCCAN_04217 [Ancylostoma caninum]|uniref:Uncharacterized protein n=1 Tax=Ancylostoma caninum TaxID=29170 RepID=A0A368H3B4_ANCCA|nr:hypothetical protein ANCCAN_04217 [Ancylostoma caninum]